MSSLEQHLFGNATSAELLWTLLNLGGLIYMLRNLAWLIQFHRYTAKHALDPDTVSETWEETVEEMLRVVVAVLFTGAGVFAMFTPEPRRPEVSLYQDVIVVVFLVAVAVNWFTSFLAHRRHTK